MTRRGGSVGCVKARPDCPSRTMRRRLYGLALDAVVDTGADVDETAERLGLNAYILAAAVEGYNERKVT